MKILKMIFLTVFVTFIQSCKYPFDEFHNSLMSRITYEINDAIKYSDGSEIFTFVVIDKTKTEK